MVMKIKIYFDSGANIKFLKKNPECVFFQYPYDSPDRPKKMKMQLAIPSAMRFKNANVTWSEMDYHTWEEMDKSPIFEEIAAIIGIANHYEDILHIDSTYKTSCHLFVTSDKTDIYSKAQELEALCGFKIFHDSQVNEIIAYIKTLKET